MARGKGGGRDRRGSVEVVETRPDGTIRVRCRLRLADGSKSDRIDIDDPFADVGDTSALEAARVYVARMQAEEDRTHALLEAKRAKAAERAADVGAPVQGETCDAWHVRFTAYRRGLGRATKRDRRWSKWMHPRIGPRPIAAVTRDDIEDVRDALDAAIRRWAVEGPRSGGISGKTAMNVWSALTSAFKAATSSKCRALRVRTDNPCAGVEPPGDRDSRKARRKTFVYPRECATLLACEDVPLAWREAHACAAYTYLRPGELRVLTWGDVDLEAGLLSVTKAWDYSETAVKPPKTRNGVRRVPLEPHLVPLLERMSKGRDAADLVVPIVASYREGRAAEDQLAIVFRRHLEAAKLRRAELHRTTPTHVRANFRSWRDSGLTWLAMTGLGVDKIMRRAGHDMVQTTMGYVKQAEDLTGDLGTPFGPLPPDLIAGVERSGDGRPSPPRAPSARSLAQRLAQIGSKPAEGLYRRRDSNRSDDVTSEGYLDASSAETEIADDDPHTSTTDTAKFGPMFGPTEDAPVSTTPADESVEAVLARALERASAAGRWDVVAQLARELEARRLAAAGNVVAMPVTGPRRGRP